MIKAKNYYDVLGLGKTATKKEIKKAYLQLAKKYHPDVNPAKDAEGKFKEAHSAYEVLYDEVKRKEYDEQGEDWNRAHNAPRSTGDGSTYSGEENDFSDIFNQFFSANREQQSHVQADEEAELYITLEEAFQGAERRILLSGRELKVNLPKEVYNGQRIRLREQSSQKNRNGKHGDLLIILLFKPHLQFKAAGYNLTAALQIAPWHAVFGADAHIQALDGKKLTVHIPSGIASGKKLRMSKQGLYKENGQRGDLYLEIEIALPSVITEQDKLLYKQLAQKSLFQPHIP